eukprot:3985345-Amphidinium_carterae.3
MWCGIVFSPRLPGLAYFGLEVLEDVCLGRFKALRRNCVAQGELLPVLLVHKRSSSTREGQHSSNTRSLASRSMPRKCVELDAKVGTSSWYARFGGHAPLALVCRTEGSTRLLDWGCPGRVLISFMHPAIVPALKRKE